MGLYDRYVLPRVINLACSSSPNMKQREKVIPRAEGNVLEIGMGSGLNLPFYDRAKVGKVWGLEPSEGMRQLARRNLGGAELDLEMIDLPGEEIPLAHHYPVCRDDLEIHQVVEGVLQELHDGGKAVAGFAAVLDAVGKESLCLGHAPDAACFAITGRMAIDRLGIP